MMINPTTSTNRHPAIAIAQAATVSTFSRMGVGGGDLGSGDRSGFQPSITGRPAADGEVRHGVPGGAVPNTTRVRRRRSGYTICPATSALAVIRRAGRLLGRGLRDVAMGTKL
jgi:hypothetical protein